MENTVVVDDYAKMDKILREERNYILQTIKKIRATGMHPSVLLMYSISSRSMSRITIIFAFACTVRFSVTLIFFCDQHGK